MLGLRVPAGGRLPGPAGAAGPPRSRRRAGDQAGEGGVHAGRAGQRPAHLGWPGQGRVAPVVGQLPEDVGDIGGGELGQVWPKARPATWPVAHTSAPAPAAAPRPTARSWSPGLVNGGVSGER